MRMPAIAAVLNIDDRLELLTRHLLTSQAERPAPDNVMKFDEFGVSSEGCGNA